MAEDGGENLGGPGEPFEMDRAFSHGMVLTDRSPSAPPGVGAHASAGGRESLESLRELREQVQQLKALNELLADDLKGVEGELAVYKERLHEERRRHPVFASVRAASHGGGGQGSDAVPGAGLCRAVGPSNVVVMPSSALSVGKTLGRGCYGETVLGTFDGIVCAVKKVYLEKEGVERAFVREVEALQKVRHPHVISLWGAVVEPGSCWLVTEYMPNGTLHEAVRRSSALKAKPLSVRMQILCDVSSGMAAMERAGVLHRDLKPSNVLLDGNLRAKVADLGLARIVSDEHVALTPETGTYLYMAPEVMNGQSYGMPADVWSWACLGVEVISLEYPYQRRLLTPLQIANEVMKLKLRPDLPEGLGQRMADLLRRCFAFDPSERPSFGEIAKEMEVVYAEERAKEGIANGGTGGAGGAGSRGAGSWMSFFTRESAGKLGRQSGGSLSGDHAPSSLHYQI